MYEMLKDLLFIVFIIKRFNPIPQGSTNRANHQPVNHWQIENTQTSEQPEKREVPEEAKVETRQHAEKETG